VWLFTFGGRRRQRPESWPAADAHGRDGRRPILTMVALRCSPSRGKKLGEARLDIAEPLVASACTGRRRPRRIRRRRRTGRRRRKGAGHDAGRRRRAGEDGVRHAMGLGAPALYRRGTLALARTPRERRRRSCVVAPCCFRLRWAQCGPVAGLERLGRSGLGRLHGLGPIR
jgi:hypothetical protein